MQSISEKAIYASGIRDILKGLSSKNHNFIGVFALNDVINIVPDKLPAAMIINTKENFRQGEHWVSLFWDKENNMYFFDSLGSFLPIVPVIASKCKAKSLSNVSVPIQDKMSPQCGLFAIGFILRCFLFNFYTMDDLNDSNIEKEINKLLKKI